MPAVKDIDIVCRASAAPGSWIYPLRSPVADALSPLEGSRRVLLPNQRVDQEQYYEEMRRSRICVSPFGYGEICWRDFEAVLCGCLLVKPDMSHIRTEPDIYVPYETYIPVKWDFSDLAAVCERCLSDQSEIDRITKGAYEVLANYYREERFIDCIGRLLGQAGLREPVSL
jgi:hypothetical protein